MNFHIFLLLFLFFFLLPINVNAAVDDLVIQISTSGEAEVNHNLQPKSYHASILVKTISDEISNILATDERGFLLDTLQQNNSIEITTLGASSVTLSYGVEIVSNNSGIWQVNYNSDQESTLILPSLSKIVSLQTIPNSIHDETIVMPPGQILIRYTISDVIPNNFTVFLENGIQHVIQIMTSSQVDTFRHTSKSISFNVNENDPVLVMIPNSLFLNPLETLLADQLIEHRNYYQNGTHSWIRLEPQESGTITFREKISTEESPIENISKESEKQGGGCLIATAAYGSELSPQVQQLRELRDNHLLQTESGTSFMSTFNDVYYSFSPIIADYERENPVFKEVVKLAITPMISSLSILNYVEMNSDQEVLGYGISLILLNVGMYFVAPVIILVGFRKVF